MRRLRLGLVVFTAVSALQAFALSQADIPAAAAYLCGVFHTLAWALALHAEMNCAQ
tara:strand:+ start:1366 stop:1533 length:168 start_codon:yes stop_codon:yes gene_type:complete